MFKWWFWGLVITFIVLTWVGSRPAEPIYQAIGLIFTAYWFGYFLVILPLLGVIEKPLAQPATIEEDFNATHAIGKTSGARALGATPAE
jgi:ubiquinol-cytochrome c reductase cytochrome b subunit